MARFAVPYDGPPRGYGNSGATKLYIAIHNTSNDASPMHEASYAKERRDDVSSHFYADDSDVVQSLDTKYDAWHSGSRWGNARGIAFELVGTNTSSEAYWRRVIDRVSPVVAAVCKAHGIPATDLTVADARGKTKRGIVTHDEMRRAWGGTTHTDPGPNFPMSYLVQRVNDHLRPTRPPAPKPAGTHTVTRGETLSGIAARYHTTVAALVALNHIKDPNRITPGHVLKLPGAPARPTTHTVTRGETLSGIAAKYHTTVAVLVRLNRITNPNRITPGQVIKLP